MMDRDDVRSDFQTTHHDPLSFGLPDRTHRVGRRGFMVTSLAVGFALAARPVRADAIETDTEGLTAGEVKVPVADGEVPAYRAMPASGGPFPTVLVVHEIFGVHEYIKDVTRRFAKLGYYAIAPELYARHLDAASIADMQQLMGEVMSKVPDAQVMSDLDAAVAFAKGESGDTERLGITGFCWGGRVVWLYAAHNPQVKAGVAWYGPLALETGDLRPKNPPDIAAELKVPVLGLYAGGDTFIVPEQVEAMRNALAQGTSGSEIVVVPEVQHGFHADYRPTYNEAAAKDGWARLLDWFKAHEAA
jgi:carboxymethylenebutenolidase